MAKYADARREIQSGDVILFHGRGPVAGVVRACQDFSAYSHTATAWVIGGRVLIIEALLLGGVRINPLSTRLADHASWISTGIFFDELRLRTAIKDLGLPYSVENCLRALDHLPGRRGAFECAQLVAQVLGLPDGGWTPEGIREFFRDRWAVPLEA